MKSIEELEKEIETKRRQASKTFEEVKDLEAELKARTHGCTKDYMGKYVHISSNDGTHVYMYVNTAEDHYWDPDWKLKGPGFYVYEGCADGRIRFETEPHPISIDDINRGYSKCEFLTKEEFYSAREAYMKKVIGERYGEEG